jgi:hypothetical protein
MQEKSIQSQGSFVHHLLMDRISFNPGADFFTCLWNADSLSSISIFFCPKAKFLNASELEKEKSFN